MGPDKDRLFEYDERGNLPSLLFNTIKPNSVQSSLFVTTGESPVDFPKFKNDKKIN